MSDDERKSKVEEGLKKLKQFQQRSGKKVNKPLHSANKTKSEKLKSSPDLTGDKPPFSGQSSLASDNSKVSHKKASSLEKLPQNNPQILSATASVTEPKDLLSSRESLLQITQRINGLMSQTHDILNGDIDEQNEGKESLTTESPDSSNLILLQRRNQELATHLNEQQQTNQQLQFQLQEVKSRLNRAQKDVENQKDEVRERAHKEQVALKDQLQVHIQTIGILIAEKTELQSTLTQSQQTAKQKAAEAEELQGRLRASRQRAADLERDVSVLTLSSQQFEKSSKEFSKEVDRLKMNLYKLGKKNDEVSLQKAELGEKLKKKVGECQEFQTELSELQSKMTMQELYIKQLTNNGATKDSTDTLSEMKQMEELHRDKLDLERRLNEYKETFQRLEKEKEDHSEQYQTYTTKMNQQIESLKSQLQLVKDQYNAMLNEKKSLETKLESLESLQNRNGNDSQNNTEILAKLEDYKKENEDMKKELEIQISDNGLFSLLIQEKENHISELEQSLARINDQALDHDQLLERMQSDKVAASRAVTQNMELKRQLQELQDAFIKLNNDKLDLTEKFLSEQHISKELGERLCQQEEELKEAKDHLLSRDQQLHRLQENSTRNQFKEHQIVDRMRHYEAQGQLSDMLQQELSQAQERINALTEQNSQLRMALARQAEVSVNRADAEPEDTELAKRNDLVASLSASVRQLELERDQLLRQMETQQGHRETLQAQMREATANMKNQSIFESEVISKEDYEALKTSTNQLEERFRKTMDQISELSDQKEQLEHLVTQLQGETDTIADYITLYQVQRGVMKQRADEKDEYISQLARDREEMKAKLSELQDLVMRLMEERKLMQSYGHSAIGEGFKPPGWAVQIANEKDMLNNTGNYDENENHKEDQSTESESKKVPLSDNTAKKIMELLNDIGTSTLVEKPTVDTFHPCPVCSGRLMTV